MNTLRALAFALALLASAALRAADVAIEITTAGTDFKVDGLSFLFTGVSFFNAIFNPTFNRDSAARREWLRKFQSYGITVRRVWAQWDNTRGFVDGTPTSTLYHSDGSLRSEHLATFRQRSRDDWRARNGKRQRGALAFPNL
jgi:hypothetical protein